ncbi:MAG: D-alanyl-D-alanine carboxypeptidase/D-alanyl-D-alanine-endopeptidase, partial [Frankiales bacterium]|nr:D-alanyl-D-alanine carboxypeptidase/D-alanyl-D-alanine-endopeptidase [Frankiales bacterium]
SAAAGDVRAKTGTLDGVSALAGLVTTRTGGVLAFDITADRVPVGGTTAAEAALDRVATAMAACGCS